MSAGWLVVVCAYGRIGRHTRANLAAMNISVDEYVAAIAAEARARVYEQLDRDQRMLDELLRPADVESYSIALYGARDRMPMQSLKLLWPTLLTNATLKRLVAAGGTCNFGHNRYPLPLFYRLQHLYYEPTGRPLWIRRTNNGGVYRWSPAESHSWVEVTHCAVPNGDVAWFYFAQGSGVSVNVGRTKVVGTAEAKAITRNLTRTHAAVCVNGSVYIREWVASAANRSAEGGGSEGAPAASAVPFAPWWETWLPFDSLQIMGHKEFYSAEVRAELVMLRLPNCGALGEEMRPAVRCGREPWLRECTGIDDGLSVAGRCLPTQRDGGWPGRVREHLVAHGCTNETYMRALASWRAQRERDEEADGHDAAAKAEAEPAAIAEANATEAAEEMPELQEIKALQLAKQAAVQQEDYDQAKKIKIKIVTTVAKAAEKKAATAKAVEVMAQEIQALQQAKMEAVAVEDYDEAKRLKLQIEASSAASATASAAAFAAASIADSVAAASGKRTAYERELNRKLARGKR